MVGRRFWLLFPLSKISAKLFVVGFAGTLLHPVEAVEDERSAFGVPLGRSLGMAEVHGLDDHPVVLLQMLPCQPCQVPHFIGSLRPTRGVGRKLL